MKRRWIKLEDVMAEPSDNAESVEYIRKVLDSGQKIKPIIVIRAKVNDKRKYFVVDGNKRVTAHVASEHAEQRKTIEAFILTHKEWKGEKQEGLFEGKENEDEHDVHYLVNYGDFRIEVREWVHVHWGTQGQYRLDLGKRDFLQLAEAISQIEVLPDP